MLHELRIYHAMPGRIRALAHRFETITVPLWERHGIRQVGFWTVGIGSSNEDLYHILEWASLDEREKKWAAFLADPEWHARRDATEVDGPLVASFSNTILRPTSFSAMK